MSEKVTSDAILAWAIEQVQGKKAISKELWLEIAFKLNLLGYDEAQTYNQMHQAVAKKKLDLKAAQEKVNVSAIEMEIEASDEYRLLKDQQAKMDTIAEFVRIAKKNSEHTY